MNIHKALPKVRAVLDLANFVPCDVDTLHARELLKDYVEYDAGVAPFKAVVASL